MGMFTGVIDSVTALVPCRSWPVMRTTVRCCSSSSASRLQQCMTSKWRRRPAPGRVSCNAAWNSPDRHRLEVHRWWTATTPDCSRRPCREGVWRAVSGTASIQCRLSSELTSKHDDAANEYSWRSNDEGRLRLLTDCQYTRRSCYIGGEALPHCQTDWDHVLVSPPEDALVSCQ